MRVGAIGLNLPFGKYRARMYAQTLNVRDLRQIWRVPQRLRDDSPEVYRISRTRSPHARAGVVAALASHARIAHHNHDRDDVRGRVGHKRMQRIVESALRRLVYDVRKVLEEHNLPLVLRSRGVAFEKRPTVRCPHQKFVELFRERLIVWPVVVRV